MSFRLAAWRFPLVLGLLLSALLLRYPAIPGGDAVEYTLNTVALATRGAADVTLSDIERVRQLEPALGPPLALLEADLRANKETVYAAFVRGREGRVYAVHFFGYAALAAPPFIVLDALGLAPFKAFQVVNLAAVFILGLALRRFFRSDWKALAGVALFMLCGGWLYWSWMSPECLTAAALLAGMLLFASGAPVSGAVLAGLAGQQNPTLMFFFGFAPLLQLLLNHRQGDSLGAGARAVLGKRNLVGLAAGMAVFALPPLFNLYQYGVPNIIAKLFSDPGLISVKRLESLFFDPNQGMIIGIPAVLAALLLWGWGGAQQARRHALLLAACALFTLALVVPALAVLNWNSGAAGVMRYAFWSAMPFVFVLLLRLREHARWPLPLLAALGIVQLAAMAHASCYHYVEFSPLARTLLARAPQLYHPEPEIFAERTGRNDDHLAPDKIYAYRADERQVKTLVHAANPNADALLCGQGAMLAPDTRYTESTRGWRYIDGPVRCQADTSLQQRFQADAFEAGAGIALASGWNAVERNGGNWNGVWSNGPRSRLTVTLPDGLRPATLAVVGHYLGGNQRTRLTVNGADLGWHRLDQEGPVALPPAAAAGPALEIELEHEFPHAPGPGDPRVLAFFLNEVKLRGAGAPAS